MWFDLIILPSPGTVTAHAPCHVTFHRGQNDPHFWNPSTQFTYSLCHFYGATTNFKPCYRRNITFSHCKSYKVNCACAVSRDLCTGGPPKPHVTIFDPELSIHYTTFMGLRWRLRVYRFILEHPHVKAVFGIADIISRHRQRFWVSRSRMRISSGSYNKLNGNCRLIKMRSMHS